MATEQQRENRLRLLEDDIGRALTQSQASGELQTAKRYGKPLDLADGYEQTPAEWRMAFKMLKDSGFAPPEVSLMREIEALRLSLEGAADDETARSNRRRLSEMRQRLAMRLESLKR